jgi:hypothetical protein
LREIRSLPINYGISRITARGDGKRSPPSSDIPSRSDPDDLAQFGIAIRKKLPETVPRKQPVALEERAGKSIDFFPNIGPGQDR